jgi:hypothetical protein
VQVLDRDGPVVTARTLRAACGAVLTALGLVLAVVAGSPAAAAGAAVPLGTAGGFAVLGASAVTSTGASVVRGDLGVSPGTSVTGFPPGVVVGGTTHAADAAAATAQDDLTTAFGDAAGRAVTGTVSADLGGQTLLPGVYDGDTLSLTGALTLDAQGDAGAVFILRAASSLVTASDSSVVLTPGTDPCRVFWLVGSSATLGTSSQLVGTVMAQAAVTAATGTDVTGRLLARTEAVTLDASTVTLPVCSTTASPSASASSSTSPTATASPTASSAVSATASPTASATASPTPSPTASPTASTSAATSASSSGSPGSTTVAAPGGGFGGGSASPVPTVPDESGGGTTGRLLVPTAAGPTLPRTGAPIAQSVLLGLVLVGLGAVLCLSALRPRRRH